MSPLSSSNRLWLVGLGLLTIAGVCVVTVLAYLLLTLPVPAAEPSPSPRRTAFDLPTAPLPTTTPGLRRPAEIKFIPEEPIRGFASCSSYGFRGTIRDSNGSQLADIQVVVWKDEAGELLALDTTNTLGTYFIEFQGKPTVYDLWVQVFQDDIPVSEPVLLKIQVDCENGFQIYQINWRELLPTDEK